jgi:aspartyl-tRNA(Asn)/glutamyl-tRNA(Gln) amidotransferase subunit A
VKSARDTALDVASGATTASEELETALEFDKGTQRRAQRLLLRRRGGRSSPCDALDERIARGEHAGSLAGVPIAIKDNLCTRGIPTTCSSRILEGWRPPYNATVLDRLLGGRGAGGKDEPRRIRHGIVDRNSAFGPTRNPLDPRACPVVHRADRRPRSPRT